MARPTSNRRGGEKDQGAAEGRLTVPEIMRRMKLSKASVYRALAAADLDRAAILLEDLGEPLPTDIGDA
jgi:hypothetical protein